MSDTPATTHFRLRDLPLPAKLVVTCFLMAVGAGYTAAMVQLHFQDSKSGEPLPTVADVVQKFTGKKFFLEPPPAPKSRFVSLITAPAGLPFNGIGTMAPAFTTRDGGEFSRVGRGSEGVQKKLQAERDGERDALVVWAESPPDVRKTAYEKDHFDAGKEPRQITPEFTNADGAIKVKSIIEARCTRCHMKDGADSKAGAFLLENYQQIERYLEAPASAPFATGGDWVKVTEPMSLDKLTQSTHAHLLSFAMLFALTGLAFAFTSYPVSVRCVVAPLVLVAVVADVSLWWLARLCDAWGPYFAMGVIGTGGLVGLGLSAQIVLSLWNMYGAKGKVVLLLIFALGGAAGAGLVFNNVVRPGLEEKRQKLELANAEGEKKPATTNAAVAPAPEVTPKKDTRPPVAPVQAGGGKFAAVLEFPLDNGTELLPVLAMPFDKKGQKRNMVRAFFDKDQNEFADAVKKKDKAEQERLAPERHGERAALTAWVKLPDAERKRVFEADAFPLPPELAGKPITKDYVADGKVKVKSIVADRCAQCHDGHADVDFNAKNYDSLLPWLEDKPAGK